MKVILRVLLRLN